MKEIQSYTVRFNKSEAWEKECLEFLEEKKKLEKRESINQTIKVAINELRELKNLKT